MHTSMEPLQPLIHGVGEEASQPLTCGLPWPRSALTDSASVKLLDAADRSFPLQTRALDHWPDGSIRWLLLDWQSTGAGTYRVRTGPQFPRHMQLVFPSNPTPYTSTLARPASRSTAPATFRWLRSWR